MVNSINSIPVNYLEQLVLAAVLVQMMLTIGLLIRMGVLRVAALKNKDVRMSQIALATDKYPDAAKKAGNALNNQFQIPTLFYALVALLLITTEVSLIHVVLAWSFVLSRIAHAFIHIGSNNVNHRFGVYLLGVIILTGFIFSVFLPIFF